MKLNKKTLYEILCYGGKKVHAKLTFRNGSIAEFRIVKTLADDWWLQPGCAFSIFNCEVERRVSKVKPMVLENK